MFTDRTDAGRRLADRLAHLRDRDDVVVLGLPRGGIPVAYEVARFLNAPLDVIVVRKLGVPYQPEIAMGAIGEGGARIVNLDTVVMAGVSKRELEEVERREQDELRRRAELFRGSHQRIPLDDKVAVIVDDGIATGSTAIAASRVARELGARRIVVAAPVAPGDVIERLAGEADEVVVVEEPYPFHAIGQFYANFAQTTDHEVTDLLMRSVSTGVPGPPGPFVDSGDAYSGEVDIDEGGVRLEGLLNIPTNPRGLVVFAHGSGSSRHSPRNRHVATLLNQSGLGTLLFDLLTPEEELNRGNVFDIELLADRLIQATRWLRSSETWGSQPIGYFGASTGAAAALWAAAELGPELSAVVSRGGRPDLAMGRLSEVSAPTLLIVGGHDPTVLDLNRRAQMALRCESSLEVVAGAGHLFEEPGTLDQVAASARGWFLNHLTGIKSRSHASQDSA